MPVITEKKKILETLEFIRRKRVTMAVFSTASHWNTEAILIAAKNYAEKNNIENMPIAIGMTFKYRHMPQCERITYCKDSQIGFLSIMQYLRLLCDYQDSPYKNITVFPHLDHADPVIDKWALTEGLSYLASVMIDTQNYDYNKSVEITRDYVMSYGDQVLIEGIADRLSVNGELTGYDIHDDYIDKVKRFVLDTGVDLIVADLGTEQQSIEIGKCRYEKARAMKITENLGKPMLVLHGTSCLSSGQMMDLYDDGIIRINMWTKIAREAGKYAAEKIIDRIDGIKAEIFII